MVNRQQNEARSQVTSIRGRSRVGNRRGVNGSTQRMGLTTGANTVAGPSNSATAALHQTTLPTDWAPRNQENTNPTHSQ